MVGKRGFQGCYRRFCDSTSGFKGTRMVLEGLTVGKMGNYKECTYVQVVKLREKGKIRGKMVKMRGFWLLRGCE